MRKLLSCFTLLLAGSLFASPTVESVVLDSSSIDAGESVQVTVTARDTSSPVNWLHRKLTGPGGKVYEDGSSALKWTDLGNGSYQCTWSEDFPEKSLQGFYTFSGIYCKNAAGESSSAYSDLKLYVRSQYKPEPVYCTVTFNANGGTCDEKSREVEVGETLGWLPDAEKGTSEFRGWWTEKAGGTEVTEDTVITGNTTLYARWFDYKTVKLTVANGFTFDPESGEEVRSVSLMSGDGADVIFDEDLIYDKWGNQIGAFQKWTSSVDLGSDFDVFSDSASFEMPDANVSVTAQYLKEVAAYVTYSFETQGGSGSAAVFYWSPDKGKTLIEGGREYPLAAGSVTVDFYAKDEAGNPAADWKAPSGVTLTIPKRKSWTEQEEDPETGKMVSVTYYEDPAYLSYDEWFVAADGARSVKFDANGGTCATAARWYSEGGIYYTLPDVGERSGYVFGGWWTAKERGTYVQEGTEVDFSAFASPSSPTLYARWLKAYDLTLKVAGFTPAENVLSVDGEEYEGPVSVQQGDPVTVSALDAAEDAKGDEYVFVKWETPKGVDLGESFDATSPETAIDYMPGANVTLTATYRALYQKRKLGVTGGTFLNDEQEPVAQGQVVVGESVELSFDESLIRDKSGETVGAFQKWVVTPADADLGEDFDEFSPQTMVTMPDSDVTVKAQYVSTVSAFVTYVFGTEGEAGEAWLYWSPDKGKTLIPSEQAYPFAAGAVTVDFYAKDAWGEASAEWKAPPSAKLTVPKRGEEAEAWYSEEWFVAADGAAEIRFDANGGKCTTASRWYLEEGGTYYALPKPDVRKGFVFDGWWTAKTGGESVKAGDAVDFSLLDGRKPTLYAHWLKAYTLTLKGEGVTAEYDGEIYEKTASVLEGGEVALSVPSEYTDGKKVAYLFQGWAPSKAYDFGEGYDASANEMTIVMPAANLTMTAGFVKRAEAAWMTMHATAEAVETPTGTIEPDERDFLWSTDGKTWYRSGRRVLVKKGSYSVQWKSANGAWAAPTAKTKVTLAGGQEYDNADDPAVFTFVLSAKLTAVVYEDGAWAAGTAGGTATMNPTTGQIPKGKSLTLTAKAAKGYAFVGWQYELAAAEAGELCPFSSAATCKLDSFGCCGQEYLYLDPEDGQIHVEAVFRPISDYSQDDVRRLFQYVNGDEPDYSDDFNGSYEVACGLGCSLELYLECSTAAKPLAYTLSGTLPKGVKFDAATGLLSGAPTAAGTYRVTVKAADPAGHACTLAVTLAVKAVPAGEWRALLTDENGVCAGLFEMSVTEAGKASGKVTTASATVSVTPTVSWEPDAEDPDGDGFFHIFYEKSTGNQKSGSSVRLTVYPTGSEIYEGRYVDPTYVVWYASETWKNGVTTSETFLSGAALRSDPAMLQDPDFKAAFLEKYYTVALKAEAVGGEGYRTPDELAAPGYLTVTTDKKGTVKVAGKLSDGEKISASTVLLTSEDGESASAVLFLVPSTYKKQGSVALQLDFSEDGAVSASVGSWVTPPLLAAIAGVEAEDEVFLPGLLALAADGRVYSALSDLTDHYLSLRVSEGGATPALEYTYTEGREKVYALAAPALTEFGIDSESGMLVGGKAGKITVGKSAAPWKDSDGNWHYDETAPDKKTGETKPILNPAGLTISYKPATGVYSGKFNLYFDYETTKAEHKAVSCSYEGVLVGDGESGYAGMGSAQYSGKFTYEYEAKGKTATKTYTKKYALPVSWTVE